jgi:hypothetical protein
MFESVVGQGDNRIGRGRATVTARSLALVITELSPSQLSISVELSIILPDDQSQARPAIEMTI